MTAPPKPPVDPVRWQPPPVDPLPDFRPAELTVIPVPGNAPEDVVVDADGNIWTGVDDGRIVRISPTVGPLSSATPVDDRWACTSPATGACWCATVRAACWRWTPAAASSRHWSKRSTGGTCSSARMSPKLADGTIYFTESTSAFTYEHFMGAILRGAHPAAACSVAIPTARC